MPSSKFDWLRRLKAVEREHATIQYAMQYLLYAVSKDAGALEGDLKIRDVTGAVARLEGTYTIRLFAEFETGLRKHWIASRKRVPPSRTRDLLDGVASSCKIPFDQIENAHAVREYRNSLVHEQDDVIPALPIGQARSHLCRFLSFLPKEW